MHRPTVPVIFLLEMQEYKQELELKLNETKEGTDEHKRLEAELNETEDLLTGLELF